MVISKLKLFTMFLFMTISVFSFSQTIQGTVTHVIDGDTFWMKNKTNKLKIRLYGVDSPEMSQHYGKEAKHFTEKIIEKKKVTVYLKYKDQYGRLVGVVVLDDGSVLNEKLLLNGAAWWYRYYAKNEKTFQVLEDYARKNKIGLWEQNNPTAPWIYRKIN